MFPSVDPNLLYSFHQWGKRVSSNNFSKPTGVKGNNLNQLFPGHRTQSLEFLIPSNFFCSPFTRAKRQITSQLYPPRVPLLNEKPLRDQNSTTFLLFSGRSRDQIIVLVCHPRYEAASKPSSYASLAIDHKDIFKIQTSAPRARIFHSTSPGLPKHSYSHCYKVMPKKALNRSYVPESYDSHFPRHDAYMYGDYADEKKEVK